MDEQRKCNKFVAYAHSLMHQYDLKKKGANNDSLILSFCHILTRLPNEDKILVYCKTCETPNFFRV